MDPNIATAITNAVSSYSSDIGNVLAAAVPFITIAYLAIMIRRMAKL